MNKISEKILGLLLVAVFIGIGIAHASQGFVTVPVTTPPGLSGLQLAQDLNAIGSSFVTMNAGTSAPTYIGTGGMWYDSTNLQLKINDGTNNEPIGVLDATSGNFASPVLRIANASSTGTTQYKLSKLTGAPSTAVGIGTTDLTGILGAPVSGAGTTGNTHIPLAGESLCIFDGATTAGDYVQASATVAGDCHDAGSTYPTSNQILGRVLSTNGGGGTYRMVFYSAEVRGSSGGGTGTVTTFSCVTANGVSCSVANATTTPAATFTLAAITPTTVAATGAVSSTQAISATSTDGLLLTNTTAATVGAQKWSPRIHFTGQGWKTASTAASQTVDVIEEVQPVQGSANPTYNLVVSGQVNAAGYAALYTVPSTGGFNLASGTYQIGGTQITCSNLSNGATGCSTATGTSGGTIPLLNGANTWSGTQTLSAVNLATDTSTGMKIGTATNQKVGFFNATPIVQPSGDALTALSNLGLVATPTLATADLPANQTLRAISFVIDGGGSTITTGVKGDLQIPYGCTINANTLLADQSGSIVVNVWKVAYASYPATVSNKITASAPPTISSAANSTDSTLTGWTTSISAGDTLRFNVDSVTTITRVTLILKCTAT